MFFLIHQVYFYDQIMPNLISILNVSRYFKDFIPKNKFIAIMYLCFNFYQKYPYYTYYLLIDLKFIIFKAKHYQ